MDSLKDPSKIYLTNGAIITDILITNNSIQVQCKNNRNRFFKSNLTNA